MFNYREMRKSPILVILISSKQNPKAVLAELCLSNNVELTLTHKFSSLMSQEIKTYCSVGGWLLIC
jgi:hypothetical protein